MKSGLARTADIRRLINDTFVLDSDLDAFCIDHYPNTFRYFTHGMNRVDKVNLLLQLNSSDGLIERLKDIQPNAAVATHSPPTFHSEQMAVQHSVPAARLTANVDPRKDRSIPILRMLTKVAGGFVAVGVIATGAISLFRDKQGALRVSAVTAPGTALEAAPSSAAHESPSPAAADPNNTKPRRLSKVMVPASEDLISISGTSSRDIWIVGAKNTVIHFNGERWSPVDLNHDTPGWSGDWKGVWSQGPDDVWIVGASGHIKHFDGRNWSAYESHTNQPLWRVWGRSAEDVWAVGNAGIILRFNGRSWLPIHSGTGSNLLTLWGNDEQVWIVGREGTILQCANDCVPEAMQKGAWIRGIFGFVNGGKTSLWAVGNDGLILRREGGIWSQIQSVTDNHLLRIWGSSVSDLWAVGVNGTVIHWDGHSWEIVPTGTDEVFSGVWGSNKNSVWFIGSNSTVMRYQGDLINFAE